MGVNNRQRRAAKQRRRGRERASHGRGGEAAGGTSGPTGAFGQDPMTFAIGVADLAVTAAVRRITKRGNDEAGVRAQAEVLTHRLAGVSTDVLDMVLHDLLSQLLDAAVDGGWSPDDLGELVRRRGGEARVAVLAVLLHEHARRHAWVGSTWRDQLDQLSEVGSGGRRDGDRMDRLVSRLWVAASLAVAPDVPPTTVPPGARAVSARPAASEADHRKLATVRALLAKAESTSYDEEAEALSVKAQELISRYALERLVAHQDEDNPRPGEEEIGCRRIWLDPPYVMAKASLVHEVADANRCRSAVTESLGFCTVVGDSQDLEAVELLVTSLLVQASRAMLRHGRQVDRQGASRTRSFRQSFLVAYAARIGDRLRATTDDIVRSDERVESLVPALRTHEDRVDDAFAARIPGVVQKATPISNGAGWVAGQVAADLALIDVNGRVVAGPGS